METTEATHTHTHHQSVASSRKIKASKSAHTHTHTASHMAANPNFVHNPFILIELLGSFLFVKNIYVPIFFPNNEY